MVLSRPHGRLLGLFVVAGLMAGCGGSAEGPVQAARLAVDPVVAPLAPRPVGSRVWIQHAEGIVRVTAPAPTSAARIYAYVATAYADVLKLGGSPQASTAARMVLDELAPEYKSDHAAVAATLMAQRLGAPAQAIVDALRDRLRREADNSQRFSAPTPPTGEAYWVERGTKPLTPDAGDWPRWVVEEAVFAVAPPPVFGTAVYEDELFKVKRAVERRDLAWVNHINFWGGVPGTATPAGIWLDRLWTETHDTLGTDDAAYARTQKILAQTLADAFIECWRVKYTYWTARPDMVDAQIDTAMANPPFPGYVSGHATVSAAAATVLARLVPDRADLFWEDAATARDSRLYAGIHLDADNQAGFALGKQVGDEIIKRLGLK